MKTASEYAMGALIRHALDKAGYRDMEPTEENLRSCFSDCVDHGCWSNLELEDVPDLSVKDMAGALIMLNHRIVKV